MMRITDVIRVMGPTPLERFPWGETVRDTVNLFLDPRILQLTEKSTGIDIQYAIDSMTDETKELVLRANLDPARHCLTTPVGGGMVVEHPEKKARQVPASPSEVEEFDEESEETDVEFLQSFMRPLTLVTAIVVMVVLAMALLLISDLSVNDDFDWKGLIDAAVEVFKPFPE